MAASSGGLHQQPILALALPLVIGIPRHLSLPENWREPADSHTIGLGSSEPLTSATLGVRNEPDTPKLLVQSSRDISGEPAPIGLTLQGGRADGAVVIIRGLLPGMELSAGSVVSRDTWQLSVSDLQYAWVAPPKDFVGSADSHVSFCQLRTFYGACPEITPG